jgi:glucose uptake protein
MFVPLTLSMALVMMIISTICWGSWANTYKLTKNYRFELFYWDYAVGVLIASLLFALTLGSHPSGSSSFMANLHSASISNMLYAALGGFIFNIANVLLLAGIEIAGLAVAFPLSIGIALVEGVVLSYMVQSKGNPYLLGAGVVFALLAVLLIGKAYGSLAGTRSATSRKGFLICIISGGLMGSFAPFNAHALTSAHPLTPYSIALFFALGAFACCFVCNTYLMKRPLVGTPLDFGQYFHTPVPQHAIGLLGGIIWGIGMVFNLVAANLVGVSVSYAIGQASPMIAALWGLLVWHEFAGAGRRARVYLAAMFLCYLLALIFIARAYSAT